MHMIYVMIIKLCQPYLVYHDLYFKLDLKNITTSSCKNTAHVTNLFNSMRESMKFE